MDVRIAMTGFGNVGRGMAEILAAHGDDYERRYGVRLLLTGVADRAGAVVSREGLDPRSLLAAKDRTGTVAGAPGGEHGLRDREFLEAAHAQILVEAATTNFDDAEPGWSYIQTAFDLGMDLVLASKGALVLHYDALMQKARRKGLRVLFSATIGAPLPVLEMANRVLIGTDILGFEGIVNATANQVLTSMAGGLSYDEGIREAQRAGIAETDPTLDVDGWDAAAKAVIIARAVLGADVGLDDVKRTGIRGITLRDLEEARLEGQAIRLIASARKVGAGIDAAVRPERRPLADPLGRLSGSEMGIVFHTDPLGAVAATVEGTGGVSTALTCLRDIVNLARERGWTSP
ncbi:MAG TPA: hypothetical protein VFB58_10045 [Chloroflexota bacterium]|nr:hypothetical protein [Chloroflexota bacterium]